MFFLQLKDNAHSDWEYHSEAESNGEFETNGATQNPNDVITLGGGGIYAPINWTFPNNRNCPFPRCSSFRSRGEAIAHFKKKHADQATLCVPCNKVLMARSLQSHKNTKTHLTFVQTVKVASNVSNLSVFNHR